MNANLPARYEHNTYLIRKKFFKIFGGAFHIFDPTGGLAFYSKMKAFKLKEDFRLYADTDMKDELLCIKARQVLDISATYDVSDPKSGERLGALRRKGLKSMFRDEWVVLDGNDREAGTIREDSWFWALFRRLLSNLVPQKFIGECGGKPVFVFKQHFNPFIQKITLDFSPDTGRLLDRRLGIAAAVLLIAIEGRQG